MTYGDDAKIRHAEYQKANQQGQEEQTTDRGLLLYANEYYQAYLTLNDTHQEITKLTAPKFYLLCHALELAFKSWLKKDGFTTKQLRHLDHNLIAMLTELVDNHGVVVAPDGIAAIEQATITTIQNSTSTSSKVRRYFLIQITWLVMSKCSLARLSHM